MSSALRQRFPALTGNGPPSSAVTRQGCREAATWCSSIPAKMPSVGVVEVPSRHGGVLRSGRGRALRPSPVPAPAWRKMRGKQQGSRSGNLSRQGACRVGQRRYQPPEDPMRPVGGAAHGYNLGQPRLEGNRPMSRAMSWRSFPVRPRELQVGTSSYNYISIYSFTLSC